MATIGQPPLDSKILPELTRGACLAAHAAAGLACGHHAARLLRAAEGLCRSAAALLQLPPDDLSTRKDKGNHYSNKDNPMKKGGEDKKEEQPGAEAKETAQPAPGARRTRRQCRRANAVAPTDDLDPDLADHWADAPLCRLCHLDGTFLLYTLCTYAGRRLHHCRCSPPTRPPNA